MDREIFYVCKYTPLELLSGFGLTPVRLDPAPDSTECADGCSHPNLCGYGKAVIEEVVKRDIRSLVLVDCCDVCRRIYDVLKGMGRMEYLFLLTLPHKNGPADVGLLARELDRLAASLASFTGEDLDARSALARWKESQTADRASALSGAEAGTEEGRHIQLTGAHGGSLLLAAIRSRTDLPVRDDTCTGQRVLGKGGGEGLQGYAAALLGQERPCMRMQFSRPSADPGALGIICHSVKFCDYYGFQYRHLREEARVPLLKIETDCTPQSSGQLHTRLDAFLETIRPEQDAHAPLKKGRYVAGVDSGSSSTDALILDEDRRIVGSAILPTGAGAASGAEKALEAALRDAGLAREDLAALVTTGYGRETVGLSDTSVTEITCHARGAHHVYPAARTVIDIGGQDSKVIRLDAEGHVENFVMNDKCAAGTGRFLEMMARTLGLSLEGMSELGLGWRKEVAISSMCTVFAESEVVSLIADNTAPADIIHGLNMAVASKTASLARRLGGTGSVIMTGGVAKNQGVVKALEERLGEEIHVPEEAQLCGALGAALFAWDQIS